MPLQAVQRKLSQYLLNAAEPATLEVPEAPASDRQRKVIPGRKGDAASTAPEPQPLSSLTAADVVLGEYADAGVSTHVFKGVPSKNKGFLSIKRDRTLVSRMTNECVTKLE